MDYLSDGYAPVTVERDEDDLPIVKGALPHDLDGVFIRNGSNPIDPDPARYHWFTGDGMVHGVALSGGRASWYRNRWVRTEQACEKLGEPVPAGQPDPHLPEGLNRANTSVVQHAGKILALYEVCQPTEITAELETIGRYDFAGRLSASMNAHPKIDPATHEMWFVGVDLLNEPWVWLHTVDGTGALVRSEPIALAEPVAMHDLALTGRAAVLFDLPAVYDLGLLEQRPFPVAWRPEHGCRVGVVPRTGTGDEARWSDLDPRYVFHTVNAWDEGDDVVVDVVAYDRMFSEGEHGIDDLPPRVERWTVPAEGGQVTVEVLDDRSQEFPRINPTRATRKNRYRYTVDSPSAATGDAERQAAVLKADPDGAIESHIFPAGHVPGEAVFVGSGPDGAEDDGWLLTIVYDRGRDASELHVLDATAPRTGPVAVVALPQRVPFGFHGAWVPAGADRG